MFEKPQEYLQILSINSHQTMHKRSISSKCLMILCLCSFFIISSTLYFFYVPQSFEEYIITVNISSTATVNTLFFLFFLWGSPKLFEVIKISEHIVEMSKFLNMCKHFMKLKVI